MLIFQINPNQLKEGQEIKSNDWLFWNAYLKERVDQNDYALLPDYIDFIINTDNIVPQQDCIIEMGEEEETPT